MPITYRFIPIYGATNYGPMCSVLEVGDVWSLEEWFDNQIRLLLDCGWDDRLDVTMLLPVLKYIPTLTAVLVSHPDFMHMGDYHMYSKVKIMKFPSSSMQMRLILIRL